MKIAFVLGIVLGLTGMLAAAHYYPWVDHPRLPSRASVQPNGGRVEQFVIRLPADRLVSRGHPAVGVRGRPRPEGVELPPELAEDALLLEHFKVRNVDGDVIGLAARHWTLGAAGPATAWSLVFPSRGAMMLAAQGEAMGRLDEALAGAGYAGPAWRGDLQVAAFENGSGALVWGSDEFDGLRGSYTETWSITGVSEAGDLRGTIELATITYQGT